MAGTDCLKVDGSVVEVLPNQTYRVELANGHRVLAFLTGRVRLSFAHLAPGARVQLEMSPYDLSEGRIVMERQSINL